jgi:hypothetical protein
MKIKTVVYLGILFGFKFLSLFAPIPIFNVFTAGCGFFMEYFKFWKTYAIYLSLESVEMFRMFPLVQAIAESSFKLLVVSLNMSSIITPSLANMSMIAFWIMAYLGQILGCALAICVCHKAFRKVGAYNRFPL